MVSTRDTEFLSGVWSAAPTPLDRKMRLDPVAVRRMVKHHIRLGVRGLFLAGSNGEGPWLTDRDRWKLVETAAAAGKGRLVLAAQVTDTSAPRILDNANTARSAGADVAVIAPPLFNLRGRPRAEDVCLQAIDQSPLPVGIYDTGHHAAFPLSNSTLKKLYLRKNVVMIKDSSGDPARRRLALACRRRRPGLRLLTGMEFDCVEYLQAGYDGALLGGGVFNGYLAGRIIDAVSAGDIEQAQAWQTRMNRLMFAVYGGKSIACWLAGEKELLVRMGIFRTRHNMLGYSLTQACSRAIDKVLEREADVLMPWKKQTSPAAGTGR